MPKLKPDIQRARREHILDAAERCFAHAGFHRTTMQDICKEAGVSPGALYVYFTNKEDLIAGICERDRAEFAERFAQLAEAPNFMEALEQLGNHYFEQEPAYKKLMCIEIGLESTRNPRVGEIQRSVDAFVMQSFHALFQRLKDEGRIAPVLTIPELVQLFMTIGDGLFWRRAVDPEFDARAVLPIMLQVFGSALQPVTDARTSHSRKSSDEAKP
jgi:TetR/AcrR family transcriptional regulator, repressor for uid operon